jgi:hypothetical protein
VRLIALGLAFLVTAAAPAPTYDWKLTPAGWGPVHIGMSRSQVERVLNVRLEGEALDDESNCIDLYSSDERLEGLFFMFNDGRLSRISLWDASTISTPRGIRLGSTADEVRAAYGEQLQAEPHHYVGEPAEYLTYWLKPKKVGVRFETDISRRVETIHAGNDSIQLVEGCA